MKKAKAATRLLLFVFLVGLISFLVAYVNKPLNQAVAATSDAITCTDNEASNCLQPIDCQNADIKCANTNPCTDPDVSGCLPGCSRNSDGICEPDPTPTPDPDTPPQVLGASTSVEALSGK
jgi:hypothetical protein